MTRDRFARDQGITLVELIAVVAILALLALIAIPAFTKDRLDSDLKGYVRKFSVDVRKAHSQALSNKEDMALVLKREGYSIQSIVNSTNTAAVVADRPAPPEVIIAGLITTTAEPEDTYTAPGTLDDASIIRLGTTGGLELCKVGELDACTSSSVTVFFKTLVGDHKSRVVIYQATSQARMVDGW